MSAVVPPVVRVDLVWAFGGLLAWLSCVVLAVHVASRLRASCEGDPGSAV
jgi:hypothetical protein